uniref:Ribonuclease H n=1 Tax=Vitis vinifera TaxID=29760 RepID=A5BTX8_VITVI|nr:hypothetical protein VITISV_008344 [Vitis vinifera]
MADHCFISRKEKGVDVHVDVKGLLRMANDVYYVVFAGRKKGIYNSWPECQEQVVGYKGNVYKLYKTFEEARRAWMFYEARVNFMESTSTPNLGEEVNLPTLMEQKGDKGMHWKNINLS